VTRMRRIRLSRFMRGFLLSLLVLTVIAVGILAFASTQQGNQGSTQRQPAGSPAITGRASATPSLTRQGASASPSAATSVLPEQISSNLPVYLRDFFTLNQGETNATRLVRLKRQIPRVMWDRPDVNIIGLQPGMTMSGVPQTNKVSVQRPLTKRQLYVIMPVMVDKFVFTTGSLWQETNGTWTMVHFAYALTGGG
jgi:hypothetical protein